MNISPNVQKLIKTADSNNDGRMNVAEARKVLGEDLQLSETEAASFGINQDERNDINKALAKVNRANLSPSEVIFDPKAGVLGPPSNPMLPPSVKPPSQTPGQTPAQPPSQGEKPPQPSDTLKPPAHPGDSLKPPAQPPKPVTPGGIQDGLEKLKKNPVAEAKNHIDNVIGNRKDPAKLAADVIKFTRSVEKMSNEDLLEVSKYLNEIMRGSDGGVDELMGQLNDLVLSRMQENNQRKSKDDMLNMLE